MGFRQQDRREPEPHPACTDRRAGPLAGQCAARFLQLLRRADQHRLRPCRAPSGQGALVPELAQAQPARATADVAADERDRRKVAAHARRDAPVAGTTLSRQAPAVGAVCLNRARTDLCGGRLATAVPTAIRASSRVTSLGRVPRYDPATRRLSLIIALAPAIGIGNRLACPRQDGDDNDGAE